jgi:tRNA pseudouridine55 synthase/H/ACA ribonucleoprotein complex subunit 4
MGLAESGLAFIDEITERAGYKNYWIKLREADTDQDYGTLPYNRRVEDLIQFGVINLDKPPGPTSHEVVAWVKKLFNVSKAGHGGTLEPPGSGAGRPQGDRCTSSWLSSQYQSYWECSSQYKRVRCASSAS